MAILYSVQKFHDYVYGRRVCVITDHKPLEHIFKKSVLKDPKRLQRMFINLKSYNLQVKWMSGSTMLIADQLKRSMDINMVHIETNHVKMMNFVEYEYDRRLLKLYKVIIK